MLNQDFSHSLLEAIFVDDGSEDGTLSILLDYVPKMGFPTVVFSGEWRGLGAARQTVVDAAHGEYIVWVDGDVILPKSYVRKQVKFMEQNLKVGVARGIVRPTMEYKGEKLVSDLINLSVFLEKQAGTSASIFRTSCLKQIGGFDRKIKGAYEDADAITRIRSAGWQISINQEAVFLHKNIESLRGLWKEYLWYGYGGHYLNHKHKNYFNLPFMVPFVMFIGRLIQSVQIYELTGQKKLFLLPPLWAFRNLAWWLGYVRSHIDSYGHG